MDALTTIVTHPLGKLLLTLLVWVVSLAYYTGAIRADVSSLRDQVHILEAKVTAIDHFLRTLAPR